MDSEFSSEGEMNMQGALGQLTEALSPLGLRLMAAPRGVEVAVRSVAIYDHADPDPLYPGDLVLGIGLSASSISECILRSIGQAGIAALVVKADHISEGVRDRCNECHVALLVAPPQLAWSKLAAQMWDLLDSDIAGRSHEQFAGIAFGDLAAVATGVADLVGGAVTIEDTFGNVVARSSGVGETSAAPAGDITGSGAPDGQFRSEATLRGIFTTSNPVYVDRPSPSRSGRAAIALRAADQVLGVMWVDIEHPLSDEQTTALRDASRVASDHVLQRRKMTDASLAIQNQRIATVVAGGELAHQAWRRLHLEGPCYVLALGIVSTAGEEVFGELSRCWDLLHVHLSGRYPKSVVGWFHGTVYGIVPVRHDSGLFALRQAMEQFLQRVRQGLGPRVRVGIGDLAVHIDDVPRSRDRADQALHALLHQPHRAPIATVEDVWASAGLLQLAESGAIKDLVAMTPIHRIHHHDLSHGTRFVETLRSWLDHAGNNEAVGRELGIHSNTVRFRIRTFKELGIIDLEDPDQRLVLMLGLRLASTT
jgi:hypothetical protein